MPRFPHGESGELHNAREEPELGPFSVLSRKRTAWPFCPKGAQDAHAGDKITCVLLDIAEGTVIQFVRPGGDQPLGGVAGPTRDDPSSGARIFSPFHAKGSNGHRRFADHAPWRAMLPGVAAQSMTSPDWIPDPFKKGKTHDFNFAIITCSDTRSMKEDMLARPSKN